MRVDENKVIQYLIVVVPLALVLTASFFITTFYLEKVSLYFKTIKERSIKEYVDTKKNKSEIWVEQLNLLFDYKSKRIDESIKIKLKKRVDEAYENARFIYDKYKGKKSSFEIKGRILDSLNQMGDKRKQDALYLSDFNARNILFGVKSNKTIHQRNRSLEEIQMVRKNKEGFLEGKFDGGSTKQVIFVKDLGIYDWYIGSSINVLQEQEILKSNLLEMLKSIPLESSDFMGLYDNKKAIYLSKKMRIFLGDESLDIISKNLSYKSDWHRYKLDDYYYYSKYYKPLDWYLVYGFEISKMSKKELAKQHELEIILDNELEFVVKASASIVIFVVILSLLLSRKINHIFSQYQEEVRSREEELVSLNESLEQRVLDELSSHRQKDKMLIQQSKMAEMGDMLSMIAHQWRQPLNQMSYLFMNLDSAYEYKELTKEYLDDKLKEGNELLEFMSITIDDFRNYFRPDKEKEFVLVSDVVKTSVKLMQKSLDLSGVEIKLESSGKELTHIYKNEFMQVMLNLIKNAKDIVVDKKTKKPKITINTRSEEKKLLVEVCDNGGGVDEDIIDKIFEPYFSTKDKQSGTGLGLYMSKMIIEEHLEGKLSVSNTKDGACFKIEI
ncbi:MAG: cache domain-containing protein [Sulfurimonas sp.]|nr:cache domain-containing protein [Sulfurimonas sp.]